MWRQPANKLADCARIRAAGMDGWAVREFWDALPERLRADPMALAQLSGAETIKESRNVLLRAPSPAETPASGLNANPVPAIWIKRFRPRNPMDWAQYALRPGKAVRGWNAAWSLLEAGIETPRPLLALRGAGAAGGALGLLVVEDAGAAETLRTYMKKISADSEAAVQNNRGAQQLATALGAFLGRLHRHGFVHRDLSGGNILVRTGAARTATTPGGPASPYTFCLLDINRMRHTPALAVRDRIRDLERVRLAEIAPQAFFQGYAQGCGEAAAAEQAQTLHQTAAIRYRRMRDAKTPIARAIAKARHYARV